MAPPLCTPTPFDDEQQQQHQESVLALLQQQEQMAAEKNAQPCKPIEAKANDAEERRQNVATLNKMPANQAQQLPTIQQTTNEEAMGGGTAAAAVVNAVTELGNAAECNVHHAFLLLCPPLHSDKQFQPLLYAIQSRIGRLAPRIS